jgi:uncharacterized protein DUF6503
MTRLFLAMLVIITLASCTTNLTDPQKIIDAAIAISGGEKYNHSTIEFDFRDRHYRSQRNGGTFSYERIFKVGDSTVHDYVTNQGFERKINEQVAEVADTMKVKYTSSVNSVIYFALLPYALNDAAVIKTFLGEAVIDQKEYYKVKVTFQQDGGGEDFEDEFIYWFDKNDFTIGYMAYSYEETDGVGLRFRKAYNPRKVNGILFLDYTNFKPKSEVNLDSMEDLFKKGELEELSKIELINIQVQ